VERRREQVSADDSELKNMAGPVDNPI